MHVLAHARCNLAHMNPLILRRIGGHPGRGVCSRGWPQDEAPPGSRPGRAAFLHCIPGWPLGCAVQLKGAWQLHQLKSIWPNELHLSNAPARGGSSTTAELNG